MRENEPVRSAETYQEGVCPVQSFVTEAIAVQPGDVICATAGTATIAPL